MENQTTVTDYVEWPIHYIIVVTSRTCTNLFYVKKRDFLNTNWNIEQQIYPLFLSNFVGERECNCFRKHFCWSINEHGLMQIKRNCCHSFVPLVSIQEEVRYMWNYHTFIRQSGIYWDCKSDGGQMHENGKTVHVNCCVCSPFRGSAFYIILPTDTRSQFLRNLNILLLSPCHFITERCPCRAYNFSVKKCLVPLGQSPAM